MQQHEAAQVLTRSARRNFWMNVGDGATFAFGLSMVSRYTVLPLFVSALSVYCTYRLRPSAAQ